MNLKSLTAKDLTVKERLEGMFVISGMMILLYYQAADFKLVLFIVVCVLYLHEKTITARKQFDAIKDELESIKRDDLL
ncbi:MAG: hypothetical protein ACI9FJ_000195 [Alteromonadaceae bacterium]|jgi:hypothetical protein